MRVAYLHRVRIVAVAGRGCEGRGAAAVIAAASGGSLVAAGSGSVTTTPVAFDGPLLVTVMV